MIQLPSNIRTTLFGATVEVKPFELFSHENDRIFVLVYCGFVDSPYPSFGRSAQDVKNSEPPEMIFYGPIQLYGPEPIWVGLSNKSSSSDVGYILAHGIYKV